MEKKLDEIFGEEVWHRIKISTDVRNVRLGDLTLRELTEVCKVIQPMLFKHEYKLAPDWLLTYYAE